MGRPTASASKPHRQGFASKATACASKARKRPRRPGVISGSAYVAWNGTYSFSAEGRELGVDTLAFATFADLAPLTGVLDFSAGGSGAFEEPRYDVKVNVQDLFFGDEGIGQVTGRLSVRDELLTYQLDAASPRLAVSGTGRIALQDVADADLSFRVSDTALDPFVRVFKPDLSPYTKASASGTIRVVGDLYNRDAIKISTTVEQLDLQLVDYRVRNQGPIALAVDGQTLKIDTMRLVGDDTALDVAGSVDLRRQALSLQANGAANLAVLQGVVRDVRSSGRADVSALIGGTVGAADDLGPGDADAGTPAPLLVPACARRLERCRHVQRRPASVWTIRATPRRSTASWVAGR